MAFSVSPGVYTKEVDQSTIISSVETSIGAVVGYSPRGPLGRRLVTNNKEFTDLYGNPVPGNYFHYTALGFLTKGGKLYVNRVVNGALYGGTEIKKNSSNEDNTTLTTGVSDPSAYATTPGWGTDGLLALFPANPGAWNNNCSVRITNVTNPSTAWSSNSSSSSASSVSSSSSGNSSVSSVSSENSSQSSVSSSNSSVSSASSSESSISSSSSGNSSESSNSSSNSSSSSSVSSTSSNSSNSSSSSSDSSSATAAGLYEFDVEFYEVDDNDVYQLKMKKTVSRKDQKNGFGQDEYIGDVFAPGENDYLIAIDNTTVADTISPKEQLVDLAVGGGSDGTAITNSQVVTGWDEFINPDEVTVNILMSGGYTDTSVLRKIDEIAGTYRKDCIGVLDVPYGQTSANDLVAWRQDTLAINSNYSALYSSWLQVYDSYNDKTLYIPPSGYIGASFAYTDLVSEAWFPNAGLNRGLLNVAGIEKNWNQAERDILYPAQINPIRNHPSGGTVIWGQKTLQTKDSALSSMNVRRLMIVLEVAISRSLEYDDFEFNDRFTRILITNEIDSYLRGIVANRGIYDYSVVCNDENNTPDVIDRREMNVDIYVQPTKAAEAIQLQAIITRTGVSYTEVIGTQ